MSDQPVDGAMFRRNYMREPFPLENSERARRRVSALFYKNEYVHVNFVEIVKNELGINYPGGFYGYYHEKFWLTAEIGDFLSAVTLFHSAAKNRPSVLNELRRIFAEEHLRYRIDDMGGVHFLVDEEFERVVQSAIAGLGEARFAGSRHALEEALKNLGATDQSGKALVRGVFEAVETAFLVWANDPNLNRLNGQAIQAILRPQLVKKYDGLPEASDRVERVVKTFADWVNSAHPFRHGGNIEQIHECPLDMAVLLATQGMAYLRYIASLGD